jgi:RNA polymerase sigma factor (sigma-70 family)
MILPKIAVGESRAMSSCITKYGTMVWSITRNYINDVTEAEDLVQEIFTEVWKKAGTFNPAIAAESTFIGLIARRRSIDFLRRKNRRPEFEPLDVAKSLIQPTMDESSAICDADAVKSSLAQLPSDTRHLFQLFFENGLTHPEIAEKTGLPLGTVKTRLRRGLISIREHLQGIGNPNTHSAS